MRFASILLTLVLAGPSGASPAAPANAAEKPTVEVLLNKLSATKNKIGALAPATAVTPKRTILIEDESGLITVAWGGVRRVPGIGGLDAFDYTSDGVFMGIQGQDLLSLSKAKGEFQKVMSLPSEDMGLAVGRGKIYLFERKGAEKKNGLFVLLPNNKGLKLFESPEPIGAVLEDGDGILFAAGTGVYRFGADKSTRLVFGLPKGSRNITSLAQDPTTKRIYASDGASVFSFKDKAGLDPVVITRENGGVLRWFSDGLIIFDPKAPLLIRISGLPS